MSDRTCSVDGCDSPPKARGWCSAHYQRWRIHGDPLGVHPEPENDLPGERWLPVVGHEDAYEVSNQGRLRSIDRISVRFDGVPRRLKGRLLHPSATPLGYLSASGWEHGEPFRLRVHVCVLEAFVGPCPEGMETRHLNGNPSDNRLDNLCWGTPKENGEDRIRHGTNSPHKRSRVACPLGHALMEPNIVNAKAERGHRQCRACAMARSTLQYARSKGIELDLVEVAAEQYTRIMNGEVREVRASKRSNGRSRSRRASQVK